MDSVQGGNMKAKVFWDIVLVLILMEAVAGCLWLRYGEVGGYVLAGVVVITIIFIWIGVTHGWHYV